MSQDSQWNIETKLKTGQSLILKYEGEDDQSFFVSGHDAARMSVSKNRNVPKAFRDKSLQPLTPSIRLLAWAFVGLAPAGLGTIILAPLAALSATLIAIAHPLARIDRKRVIVIWGISILLLAIAIPISVTIFAHFIVIGSHP
jgi:hypothetical protein